MRSLVRAALDGHQGTTTVDNPLEPSLALLTVGRFIALGGNPSHSSLQDLLLDQPAYWVMPEDDVWLESAQRIFGTRVRWRDRIRFEADTLSRDRLVPFLPAPPDYSIQPIDRDTLTQITRPDGTTGAFPNTDAFLERGLGYAAIHGDRPVGFAMSYATYDAGIEIDLWIHEAHRRRGLATAVSAHLIDTCLARGLEPHWDAANDESANLAEKLGYRRAESYRMIRRLHFDESLP